MHSRKAPRARTYVTVTCEPCGKKLSNNGSPYFVRREHAETALAEHALAKHATIGSEKVAVKRTVSYEVVRS